MLESMPMKTLGLTPGLNQHIRAYKPRGQGQAWGIVRRLQSVPRLRFMRMAMPAKKACDGTGEL